MSSKEKKDKSDKKEKSDKKDKADKSDKKEKTDKKDKADKSDKKDKSDKSDKKDKADKSDKKDKADKKDKSDKKEKSEKTDKKENAAEVQKAKDKEQSEDIRLVGATTYSRIKQSDKASPKKGTGVSLWVPEGKTIADKGFVWQEQPQENGETQYVLLADPDNVRYDLPDIGGAQADVSMQKKKLTERKEWDETGKRNANNLGKKVTAALPQINEISKDEQAILASNVSKEYMSQFKALDLTAEAWMEENASNQLNEFLRQRKAAKVAHDKALAVIATVQVKATERISGELEDERKKPIPNSPLERPPAPLSPLLPRANYLRDPYYYRRVTVPAARRSPLESKLEQTVFMRPGGGEIKVLCVVGARVGADGKPKGFAVIRDWCGAFCLATLDYNDGADPRVESVVPILEHVDFPSVGFQKISFSVDDTAFIATFNSQDHATWLNDALKMAMCAMYGNGSDDTKIIHLRARSLEFSTSEPEYLAQSAAADPMISVRSLLREDRREGEAVNPDFDAVRLAVRLQSTRDVVLTEWCFSVKNAILYRRRTPAMVSNHLRIMDEVVRSSIPLGDRSIAGEVFEMLSWFASADFTPEVQLRATHLRTQWKVQLQQFDKEWTDRFDVPAVPLEPCFTPEAGTAAERQEKALLIQRRVQASSIVSPPGVYLTMICYCGQQVLCTKEGTFFSEQIIAKPSLTDLQTLTPESDDFQWVLQLGGCNENWASEVDRLAPVYQTHATQTFRARFLHAATRLLHSQPFSTLGLILDVPIHQQQISCAHIVTVLRIDSKERVPAGAGVWKQIGDLEDQYYVSTLMASENSRISFLPMNYRNCSRFISASIQCREQLSRRIPKGFYVGLIVVHATSSGPMVLVPESNRLLPPLAFVSDEAPTVAQWRWLQSLNERKRRTRMYDFDGCTSDAPFHQMSFEQRFAKGCRNLEAACGISIDLFYDTELMILDELQSIRGFFAVHFVPPTAAPLEDLERRFSVTVPMVFKSVAVLDDVALRMYWGKVYPSMAEEREALRLKALTTTQPFATDEVLRHQHECTIAFACDIDKYCMMLSWLRPLVAWTIVDARPLVMRYGGTMQDNNLMSIEDCVDAAVANYASSQDVNYLTLRSLLYDSATKPFFSWTTLLSQLRDRDKVLSSGYTSRAVSAVDTQRQQRQFSMRNYDEIPAEDFDLETPRPPAVYEVPCSLVELVFRDLDVAQAEKYFAMNDIVNHMVDLACVECVEGKEIALVGDIIRDMVTVMETTQEMVSSASSLALKEDALENAWKEREKFHRHWLELFRSESGKAVSGEGETVRKIASMDEDDPALGDPTLSIPLFYDGSQQYVTSFADGVRVCLSKALNSCDHLQTLLRVSNSAVEALELIGCLDELANAFAHRDALVGTDSTQLQEVSHREAAQQESRAGVVLVSREFDEYFVPPVDPLRCLSLFKASGKVRYPLTSSGALEVLVGHLRTPDLQIPQNLELLPSKISDELLDMAVQMKAPLLFLRLMVVMFSTKRGGATLFDLRGIQQLRSLAADSFLFEFGVRDWRSLETLGGGPVLLAMDAMWWLRYLREASAEQNGNASDAGYHEHEGNWRQVYAEARVRVFLTYGVHALSADEVKLWTETLGHYVEYMSLRDTTIGDAEVEILVQCCPLLKSLDLSFTNISGKSISHLVRHAQRLAECSTEGCRISVTEEEALRRHCTATRRRGE